MRPLIIPDAGPLFSLAAADVLSALLHFPVIITDVVKQETIDKGALVGASLEARRLHAFYLANRNAFEVRQTQFGSLLAMANRANPRARIRNAGELSIQSLLIELTHDPSPWEAALLFEDSWFIGHATSFPPNCRLVSTSAFLEILERLGLIASAQTALNVIRSTRSTR